jgi:hypothetical protein
MLLEIIFLLKETPPGSCFADRIGERGTEYVSGQFDHQQNIATVSGYAVSDTTFLSTDSYIFWINGTNGTFSGSSVASGKQAQMGGIVNIE